MYVQSQVLQDQIKSVYWKSHTINIPGDSQMLPLGRDS